MRFLGAEQFYLGTTVSQLERKQVLPNIAPQRERLLEYDLIRAIARVAQPERPKIGLMSSLPVMGERFNLRQEISSVLTPEQKTQLEHMREQRKAKREEFKKRRAERRANSQ